MRAFLILAAFGLPLATPAAAASQTATIKGRMKVSELECRGVKLIPRTAESEREIAAMFGTTDRAVSAEAGTGPNAPPRATGDSLRIDGRCTGWTQRFSFRDVAPGGYFVTALGTNGIGIYTPGADAEQNFGKRTRREVYFMQPVRVTAADRTVEVVFRQD